MDAKFNVYVVRDSDDVAVSKIGSDMREERADTRCDTAMGRINFDEYSPKMVEVGSEDDKRYEANLAKS